MDCFAVLGGRCSIAKVALLLTSSELELLRPKHSLVVVATQLNLSFSRSSNIRKTPIYDRSR